jgi:hypothetical protein
MKRIGTVDQAKRFVELKQAIVASTVSRQMHRALAIWLR